MKTNFDLGFSSALVLRTPAYSYEDYKPGEIPLYDPYFRSAILIASPALYGQLKKKDFKPENLSDREIQTVLKYWNRACYRPTPFGFFAAISYARWENSNQPISLADKKSVLVKYSFAQSCHIANAALKLTDIKDDVLAFNSTLYPVKNTFRYLLADEGAAGRRQFAIGSIDIDHVLLALMEFGSIPQKCSSMIDFLVKQYAVKEEEGLDYLQQLISEQVLVSRLQPNITGDDYLSRIDALFQETSYSTLENQIKKKSQHSSDAEMLIHFEAISSSKSILQDEKSPLFVNTRQDVSGTLNQELQDALLEGIKALRILSTSEPVPALNSFKEDFRAKFEQQAIPLLFALDPETGVAYNGMESSWNISPILKGVHLAKQSPSKNALRWGQLQSFLLRKYTDALRNGERSICLTNKDIEELDGKNQSKPLAPSFNVLFRVTGDTLLFEQVGGVTATGLTGRFSLVDANIHELTIAIAEHEQRTNPDVLFAELVHWGELHTANIERREIIRPFEIPVLTVSSVPEEQQIQLNDLVIKIEEDQLCLWSVKHQKRVVPRLSSAYNFSRTTLSVYRFLCDLQYQDLHSNLTFRFEEHLPDLDFYPRVQYGSTILYLATWKISHLELGLIFSHSNILDQKQELIRLLVARCITGFVSLIEHDHQIVFNLDEYANIDFLLQNLKGQKKVTIQEFIVPEKNSHVIDGKGKPYISQFIASILNNHKVYEGLKNPIQTNKESFAQRSFTPGDEWLYYKLYCHPSKANQLLTENIFELLETCSGQIQQWFFVRYNDPSFHLRLRFKVSTENQGCFIKVAHQLLDTLVQQGIISRIIIDTYERELERYDPLIIEKVEAVFYRSSLLVLDHLKHQTSDEASMEYYKLAFNSLNLIAEQFYASFTQKEFIFGKLADTMLKEFDSGVDTKNMLKSKYREIRQAKMFDSRYLFEAMSLINESYRSLTKEITILLQDISNWSSDKRTTLFASLVHMHLNRLFVENSREQELVVYYCLSAWYYGEIGRKEKIQAL